MRETENNVAFEDEHVVKLELLVRKTKMGVLGVKPR